MNIIKLNATDSTNSYLRRLSYRAGLEDFTAVIANYQTKGRGQMGAEWQSEKSKNLTASVFKNLSFLDIEKNFSISMAVSISIIEALKTYQIKSTKVKWPNDILADDKKIGGILIENIIKKGQLIGSIVGIGINVNQTSFSDLPRATSLRLITGRVINIDELFHSIVERLKINFNILEKGSFGEIKSTYLTQLFRNNKPSTFENSRGETFSGYIKGVADNGSLQILIEDDIIEEFNLKEVTLRY